MEREREREKEGTQQKRIMLLRIKIYKLVFRIIK